MEFCVFSEAQEGASYEQQRALALAAEAGGYDGFFRSDHLMSTKGAVTDGTTETWVTLAGLARETSTIRLGSLMNITEFRAPAVLPLQVAQVAAMSGGRLELGVGAAWFEPEHTGFGLAFGEPAERIDRLAAQLAALRPLVPGVPVILGGRGGEGEADLAALHADEVCANFAPPALAADIHAAAAAACEQIGRDPRTLRRSVIQTVLTGPDDAAREARLSRLSEHSQRMVRNELFGTPAEVVAQLDRYADLGVDRVYLQFPHADDVEYVTWVAEAVLDLVPRAVAA